MGAKFSIWELKNTDFFNINSSAIINNVGNFYFIKRSPNEKEKVFSIIFKDIMVKSQDLMLFNTENLYLNISITTSFLQIFCPYSFYYSNISIKASEIYFGKGFINGIKSIFMIEDSNFFADSPLENSLLCCQNCDIFNVSTSNFFIKNHNFSNQINGGFINLCSEDPFHTKIIIEKCDFENSSISGFGGAIFIQNGEIGIYSNLFKHNNANDGGALFLSTNNTSNIINNTFERNNAFKEGGAVKYLSNRPIFQNNTFLNNSAYYGNDVASYPIKISYELNLSESRLIQIFPSENKLINSSLLTFVLLDAEGQIVNNANGLASFTYDNKKIEIVSNFDSFFINSGKKFLVFFNVVLGKFEVFGLGLRKAPLNFTFAINLNSNLITETNYSCNFELNTAVSCPSNLYYDKNKSFCNQCDNGFYIRNGSCTECPEGIEVCYGNVLKAKPGYFLTSDHTILSCQPNQDACL